MLPAPLCLINLTAPPVTPEEEEEGRGLPASLSHLYYSLGASSWFTHTLASSSVFLCLTSTHTLLLPAFCMCLPRMVGGHVGEADGGGGLAHTVSSATHPPTCLQERLVLYSFLSMGQAVPFSTASCLPP